MTSLLIALAAAVALVWAAVYFVKHVWFYRDPPRGAPQDEALVRAPCDGKVMYVRRIEGGAVHAEKLGQRIALSEIAKADLGPDAAEGWIIGIYMTPLDVHYNFAPISGTVTRIVHTQAAVNLPMVDLWEYLNMTWLRRAVDLMGRRFHLENERTTMFLENPRVRLATVAIADKFVNKIRTFIGEGERVEQGRKVAFIARGSQVDVLLFATDMEILVRENDQTYGAETPLARLPPAEARRQPAVNGPRPPSP